MSETKEAQTENLILVIHRTTQVQMLEVWEAQPCHLDNVERPGEARPYLEGHGGPLRVFSEQ